MRYLPHTNDDVRTMLARIGVGDISDLFTDVPADLRARATVALPPGLSEQEVRARLEQLAARNRAVAPRCFLGAGAYPHFVPAVVDQVLQRAEFYSAYTPYQPEVSQGTLQAIFEFQTLVAMLLEMDVANASMYDGASAAAEAVLMALRIRPKRSRVILSRALHPQYRDVIRTYAAVAGGDAAHRIDLVEAPVSNDGRTDPEWLAGALSDETAAVVVGYPNFFGVVEDLGSIGALAQAHGALLITTTTEALALGLLKPPGACGADIAVAEGQSLGVPMSYGGPGVGLFATRTDFVRMMPGRLVGEAVDGVGRRGFVLTLATREQHIRREKATSNICTNQGLVALAVTVYLSTVGKAGLRELAIANTAAAHRVAERLVQTGRWHQQFSAPFFNEFVVRGANAEGVWKTANSRGVLAGLPLRYWYPEFGDALLLCVTEMHDSAAADALVVELSQ
ncbi:MAG TPA: aminomethyl-transferring glycine dehydrogenase subunit GcvPA [Candidatus Margulisiibacteriota bacterium]|nr:aminomethyl-transferring glycine dehydrogenase subunit GcvPA [Candidatus Margulisiibacteriota bacterium]